jgi:hypothetical protein
MAYRHDANTAIRSGTDTNRPPLDLLADEFLDIRQVRVGFEVTPVSAIARASHRCVLSMPERGSSAQAYVSVGRMSLRDAIRSHRVVFRKHDRQNESRNLSEKHSMGRLRFHLGTLVILVLLLGVGFAALREASDLWESGLFTLAICVLLISILPAIHRTETRRAFWLGFALFGWGYLGLSVVPSIETRLITTMALAYLDSKVPRRPNIPPRYIASLIAFGAVNNQVSNVNVALDGIQSATTGQGQVRLWNGTTGKLLGGWIGTTENFVRIGHSLFALMGGWFGGQLSRRLCRTSRSSETSTAVEIEGTTL